MALIGKLTAAVLVAVMALSMFAPGAMAQDPPVQIYTQRPPLDPAPTPTPEATPPPDETPPPGDEVLIRREERPPLGEAGLVAISSGGGTQTMPDTGGNVSIPLAIGSVSVGAGGVFLLLARKREQSL